ncbi:MAG: hypothetical protein DYG85_06385 [Chloroflexi bacterium CFX1]|nr:hypothetical protein Rctr41k_27 [Virus Rctr41k]MCE7919132.1 hypothetical protein [Chloroflexi bacterium CFX1]
MPVSEIAVAILSLVGAYAVSRMTVNAGRRKMDAEIDEVYARLGMDRQKTEAESANTWMDVARKAADEYERVMDENRKLKKRVSELTAQVSAMKKRIRVLEEKRKRR